MHHLAKIMDSTYLNTLQDSTTTTANLLNYNVIQYLYNTYSGTTRDILTVTNLK